MPHRGNLALASGLDSSVGEAEAATSLSPAVTVALIGSALAFSDQMIRALSAEFSDVLFRRLACLDQLRSEGHRPRLIVLDCAAVQGLVERVQALRSEFRGATIAVAYQSADSAAEVADRVAVGAIAPPIGLIRNNVSLDVWLSVVRLLLCGENYIPFELVTPWHLPAVEAKRVDPESKTDQQVAEPSVAGVALTPREMQVLPLIAEGKQNKEIAGALGLSEHTVKLHTHNIFVKLKVSNRTSAADWYRCFMREAHTQGGRWNGSAAAP